MFTLPRPAAVLVLTLLAVFTLVPPLTGCFSGQRSREWHERSTVRVLSFNIFRGGREDGEQIGPQRVVDVIRTSQAGVIALQETYGSGEFIAGQLGYHFHPRGTNVSIISKYPIIEDLSVSTEFHCVGARLRTPTGDIAFYSIWLPYASEIWEPGTRDNSNTASLLAACEPSHQKATEIMAAISTRLSGPNYEGLPLIIAGDFNSMSHLDYVPHAQDQYNVSIEWPTSKVMSEAGLRDAYRECKPVINRMQDRTWTPRFPDQEQDRIDYVYYRNPRLTPMSASVIDQHPQTYPSDHAALFIEFHLLPFPATPHSPLRTVTYNIHHGRGEDGRVDLSRANALLNELAPQIIALQEVDVHTARSGNVNQPAQLSLLRNAHAAFGAFMPYDGGRYGMAILSVHPIISSRSITLPTGNEPRIALIADIRLPCDTIIHVVNVHFDWVDDDSYRFAQASYLANELKSLPHPYIILGDFNDSPTSRTLSLFSSTHQQALKPADDRCTFPASNPTIEIDYIFTSHHPAWKIINTFVARAPNTSDHRPVVADLFLQPGDETAMQADSLRPSTYSTRR
jgi:endonuclease/exonuclease/phosphatase family metal-dependent hydrolase